jgi:hypothetical protein
MEEFVHSDVDKFALSIFVKIRIRNSNLNIERGRYIKLPVEKRICPLCNIEPEDEIHFILKCPKLDECRKELFSNISSVVPSFNDMDEFQKLKFIRLLLLILILTNIDKANLSTSECKNFSILQLFFNFL